ncbi:MAG: ABC transporter ATP-binding protein [Desulfatiglans sp.]|jgi:branched-chain amino acid transport system ATP-binding protein|nr:ABC transporter ATP-binding protein [Thermodesulfobacteriota bacterium]MEE4353926.1 ABC transporter ATP-binding protein [Desulfatiglans sp.]
MGDGQFLLRTEDITLSFGGVQALSDVNVELKAGDITSLIGPNGAGKSSFLNCLSGFYRPQRGSVYLNGEDITRLPSYKVAEMGIGRTFQGVQLFEGLTVQDNIMAGRHIRMKTGILGAALYFGPSRAEDIRHRKVVEDIIDFLEIKPIRKALVGALPFGMKKKVDMARALALEPKILLLDEPLTGMSRDDKEDMARFIYDLQEEWNMTVLVVEHDMGVVMDISDKVVVLEYGRKIAEGLPEEIRQNEHVIKAYLGKSH